MNHKGANCPCIHRSPCRHAVHDHAEDNTEQFRGMGHANNLGREGLCSKSEDFIQGQQNRESSNGDIDRFPTAKLLA